MWVEQAAFADALSFLKISFLWMVFVFWFFVPWEETVINLWARFLYFVALSFWFVWIQMATIWVLRVAWNMKTALILTLISQWVLQFPLAYILSKHTSLWLDWIWISILVTNVIIAIVSLIIFLKWDWKNSNLTEDDKMKENVFEETSIERWYRH